MKMLKEERILRRKYRTAFSKSLTIGDVLDRKYKEIVALRAKLAEARRQLCAAREALDGPGAERHHGEPSLFNGGFNAGVYSCRNRLKAALSSSAPCPHEAEAKRLRQEKEAFTE